MVEEEKQEEEEVQEEEKDEDDNSEEEIDDDSPIQLAMKINKENKELLEAMTKERQKIEKLQADMLVSGKGKAGQTQETHEETPKEYTERVMSGKL